MKNNVISVDPFVVEIPAERLRVGKQVLTDDGWQTIRGILAFQDDHGDQVSVYTDERDDLETSGWSFRFGQLVQSRLEPTAEQEYQRKRAERRERKRLARLAAAVTECPVWCNDHFDAGEAQGRERNHSCEPQTVVGVSANQGAPAEFGFWLEKRDKLVTNGTETVVVLELAPHTEDIELTPDMALKLSALLSSYAHRAGMYNGKPRGRATDAVTASVAA